MTRHAPLTALVLFLAALATGGCATAQQTAWQQQYCAEQGSEWLPAAKRCRAPGPDGSAPATVAEQCASLGSGYQYVAGQNRCRKAHRASAGPPINPIVDRQATGFDPAHYSSDLAQCNAYADQVQQQALSGALGGALLGAAFGALIGDSYGDASSGAVAGAKGGALGGGVGGAANTHLTRHQVVRNCLAGRGYSVLGR